MALAAGFAIVAGLQLGRSLANLVAGVGWTWPDPDAGKFSSPIGTAFWTSLSGVVTGDSSAGLAQQEVSNGRLAGPSLTWGCLVVTELLVVVVLGWLAIFILQRWGPGRMRGMATSAEAERMLGVARLRKVAGIVRPDLHGKHANPAPTTSVDGLAGRVQRTPGEAAEEPGPQLGRRLSPWLVAGRGTKEKR
ncbi:MAG: hypothetical protein CMJ44_15210 [Pimelobacter sp.]|nr:hypothetical protein [Pimelobacter sp.]